MDMIWGMITIVLLLLVLFQRHRYKQQQANLLYAHTKLKAITDQRTEEKLLLQTEDIHLKALLNEINRLLEHNQKTAASYYQMEISIRKMLSNISHDLRTPLTVVLGYLEVILNDPELTRQEVDVLLAKVHNKSIEVLHLMKKFFDLVKLESGDHEIEISKIDVSEICQANILAFYDILTARDIEVVIDIPDDRPCLAYGNEEELHRILNNLLSNAIQYGSEGHVVGLSVYRHNKHIGIDIWDRGQGIGEKHQDRVFERMYTLEDSRNRLYQGSGLGLTITKRLVEKMGGTISVTSTPYQKTVFTVMLKSYA
ncbi:sensor histidine kinase [Paenibacillus bovis]|uniref:histidine kinase n=1 Tax=Paenibacillus bovis TaxID=1616788 RepID=A0A172ZK31_9BACL|nr:sensor histidine kinase [Paenibacillus bovis]ANF97772.1 two-component sensor histidine kinase [Paenibacillus bovis]